MNEIYSRSHTNPQRAYLPPREFALVWLKTAVALIPAAVGSVVIVPLIAFIAPVLVVEEDVGFGDDEEATTRKRSLHRRSRGRGATPKNK